MRFLENMISGMVKDSTGINPRRLVRMVGGKNILLAGGVALAGALAAGKMGSGGANQDPAARWTGGQTEPKKAPPPPPPPPGSPPPAPPSKLPPIPGSRPDGMEGDPPPVETPAEELTEEAAREAQVPPRLLFAIVRTLVAAALADGHLADEEKAAIEEHLEESGLSEDQLARIRKDLVFPAPPEELASLVDTPEERRALYRFAVLLVQTDQDVASEELAWLDRFAGQLGLGDDEAAALRDEVLA